MQETLAYWNFVPENERTTECPSYLQGLSDKDKRILGSWDSDFEEIPWDGEHGVKNIVLTNQLNSFRRSPSQLRAYRKYMCDMTRLHGNIMDFILNERLGWSKKDLPAFSLITPLSSTSNSSASSIRSFQMDRSPFDNKSEWKILRNDWPYGIDARVVHLVVWTKFSLIEDPQTGDLTTEMRRVIDDFVDEIFRKILGQDNVVWFKNWKSLKSIPSIEHFHVMLFNPDSKWIEELTGETDVYRA